VGGDLSDCAGEDFGGHTITRGKAKMQSTLRHRNRYACGN
jgi:hypothetical protein